MNPSDYIKNVLRTESSDISKILPRFSELNLIRLLHAVIGISTESGELMDAVKKHIFYGREIDKVNIKEEIGDLLWYVGVLLDVMGCSFEDIMDVNIKKLKERYNDKFSEKNANFRNLENERAILEGKKEG